MSRAPQVPRRRFLMTLGLGVSAALTTPVAALAQMAPAPARPDTTKPDTTAAKPPEISEEAKTLAGILRKRYGKDWTEEQFLSIARDFDGDLRAGKRLREAKLVNADEPDFTFHA